MRHTECWDALRNGGRNSVRNSPYFNTLGQAEHWRCMKHNPRRTSAIHDNAPAIRRYFRMRRTYYDFKIILEEFRPQPGRTIIMGSELLTTFVRKSQSYCYSHAMSLRHPIGRGVQRFDNTIIRRSNHLNGICFRSTVIVTTRISV